MEQNTKNFVSKIPKEVSYVTDVLEKAGFEAYLVGGCIRDLLMEIEPKDWDITTNAKPEQIIGLFEKTIYENTFGTVGVVGNEYNQHPTSLPALSADRQAAGRQSDQTIRTFIQCEALAMVAGNARRT